MPTLERVQVIKQESTALGGDDADSGPELNYPIDPFEDVIEAAGYELQEPGGTARDDTVRLLRSTGKMTFKDQENTVPVTLTDLVAGAGGISEATHETLDTLTHEIDESSFEEYTYASGRVTNVTVWKTAAKLLKVREEQYTYTAGRVTQAVTIQYDGTGTVKMTMTEDYAYTAGQITSVTRTKS